jgi:hypothetical protein
MDFEQTCIQYLSQLRTDGIIIEGDLYGVNEDTHVAKAIVSILQNGKVNEKSIILYEENENLIWKFLNVLSQNEYDYISDEWGYTNFSKRIVAPVELIMTDVGIKIYGWFTLNNLPVRKINDTTVHLYCNVILPEHQAVVDSLQGQITIEDRP